MPQQAGHLNGQKLQLLTTLSVFYVESVFYSGVPAGHLEENEPKQHVGQTYILSGLSATANLCIVVEFMTWREAQMEDESCDLRVASQAAAWPEPRMRKRTELHTGLSAEHLIEAAD